jgi:hypothetical protein
MTGGIGIRSPRQDQIDAKAQPTARGRYAIRAICAR